MEDELTHEIELYPLETFKTLLDHEVKRSRRYRDPLTLIHLAVETNVREEYAQQAKHAQYGAEVFAINALNLQVRDTDIPCRMDNEFLVLMPATDEQGGRVVCRRLEKLFNIESQIYDKVSFTLSTYIGMASLSREHPLSSSQLMSNASKALEYARANHLQKAVVFSDIKN